MTLTYFKVQIVEFECKNIATWEQRNVLVGWMERLIIEIKEYLFVT